MFVYRFPHLQLSFCGAALCCILLASCADTEWPRWITGEPTKAELQNYNGPIIMPAEGSENKAWPNLADVPPRPDGLMPAAETENIRQELKQKNAEGQATVAAFQAGQKKTSAPKASVVTKKKSENNKKTKKKKNHERK